MYILDPFCTIMPDLDNILVLKSRNCLQNINLLLLRYRSILNDFSPISSPTTIPWYIHTGKRRVRGRHNVFRARCPSKIHFLLGGRRVSATAARSGNEPETGNKSATTATAAAATTYHRGGGSSRGFYLSIALH